GCQLFPVACPGICVVYDFQEHFAAVLPFRWQWVNWLKRSVPDNRSDHCPTSPAYLTYSLDLNCTHDHPCKPGIGCHSSMRWIWVGRPRWTRSLPTSKSVCMIVERRF